MHLPLFLLLLFLIFILLLLTCMALTAPQDADMEDSLSNVTLLGRFCTSTRSVVQAGGVGRGGGWPWGVMVMEVREGEGLCRMGAGWRGVLLEGREGGGALCRGGRLSTAAVMMRGASVHQSDAP